MEKYVKSICPYCGCACKLIYKVSSNSILKVLPCKEDRVSRGKPCIKGLTVHEVFNKNRVRKPVIRKDRNEYEVSIKRAVEYVYENIKDLDPGEIAVFGSGKITNESNYALLKLARGVLKTNNVDSCCGRLCHIATVRALSECFGIENVSYMEDVYSIDVLLVIGSNPAVNYPVFFNRVMDVRKKIKLVSVQPFCNQTSTFADIYAEIEPGTEVVFLNALCNYIISNSLYDKDVESVENFSVLKKVVKSYTPEVVEKICGIDRQKFAEIAEVVGNSECLGVFHGMGLTQHINALKNVLALLNLVVLKKGKVLSLRGEVNVQGVGDIGFVPERLPTGGFETVGELERLWTTEIPLEKGKNIVEALLISPVKACIVTHFNPAQSMPALDRVHKNLEKMFLVVLESYNSLTAEFADVVIPTPALFEREGTITNGERMIRKVNMVVSPPKESIEEYVFARMLAKMFGKEELLSFSSPLEIFREICAVVPDYRNVSPELVYSGRDAFARKEIRYVRFMPVKFEGKDRMRSKNYPFILTTFRSRFQFLTSEMTCCSETLKKLDEGPVLFMNSEDAKELGVRDGDVVRVISEESSIEIRIKTTNLMPRKTVATRFHYKEVLINKLFPPKFDRETHTPAYKCVAVRIEKVG